MKGGRGYRERATTFHSSRFPVRRKRARRLFGVRLSLKYDVNTNDRSNETLTVAVTLFTRNDVTTGGCHDYEGL